MGEHEPENDNVNNIGYGDNRIWKRWNIVCAVWHFFAFKALTEVRKAGFGGTLITVETGLSVIFVWPSS